MGKAHRGVDRLARAVGALVLGSVILLTQIHSAEAQTTDPYTGGTVTPPASCPTPPRLSISPSSNLQHGQPLTVTTTGVTPGGQVFIFTDSVLTSSGNADANGTFVTTVQVPVDQRQAFMVCATAPPCAMVCIDPVAISGNGTAVLGDNFTSGDGTGAGARVSGFASTSGDNSGGTSVLGRGFARTGFELLPWLLAGLLCILIGRKLTRISRRNRKHPRVARLADDRENALVS